MNEEKKLIEYVESLDDYIHADAAKWENLFKQSLEQKELEIIDKEMKKLTSAKVTDETIVSVIKDELNNLYCLGLNARDVIDLFGKLTDYQKTKNDQCINFETYREIMKNDQKIFTNKIPEEMITDTNRFFDKIVKEILTILTKFNSESFEYQKLLIQSGFTILDILDQNSKFNLISEDNIKFSVQKKILKQSKFFSALIENDHRRDINCRKVDSIFMKLIIDFMNHHHNNDMKKIPTPLNTSKLEDVVDKWDADFAELNDLKNQKTYDYIECVINKSMNERKKPFKIINENERFELIAYQILYFASYWGIDDLVQLMCARIAILQRDYPPERLHGIFNIQDKTHYSWL